MDENDDEDDEYLSIDSGCVKQEILYPWTPYSKLPIWTNQQQPVQSNCTATWQPNNAQADLQHSTGSTTTGTSKLHAKYDNSIPVMSFYGLLTNSASLSSTGASDFVSTCKRERPVHSSLQMSPNPKQEESCQGHSGSNADRAPTSHDKDDYNISCFTYSDPFPSTPLRTGTSMHAKHHMKHSSLESSKATCTPLKQHTKHNSLGSFHHPEFSARVVKSLTSPLKSTGPTSVNEKTLFGTANHDRIKTVAEKLSKTGRVSQTIASKNLNNCDSPNNEKVEHWMPALNVNQGEETLKSSCSYSWSDEQSNENLETADDFNSSYLDTCNTRRDIDDKSVYTNSARPNKIQTETDLMTNNMVEGIRRLCLDDRVEMHSLGSGSSMVSSYSQDERYSTKSRSPRSLSPSGASRLDETSELSLTKSTTVVSSNNVMDIPRTISPRGNIYICSPIQNLNSSPSSESRPKALYNRTADEVDVDVARKEYSFDLTSTSAWKSVEDSLDEGHKLIFVIGSSKHFKDAISLQFLLHLREDYAILSLHSADEWSKCCNDGIIHKAVLMKDAFGVNKLNETRFDQLSDVIRKRDVYCEVDVIMFTMTHFCYHACQARLNEMVPYSRLNEYIIDLENDETDLCVEEKRKQLKHLLTLIDPQRKDIFENDVEIICKGNNPIFLDCCSEIVVYERYDTNLVRFFKQPMNYLYDVISSLREEWSQGHLVLLLVALCGELKTDSLAHIAEEYLKMCHKSMDIGPICEIADMLCESYLEFHNSMFRFRHQMYQNAVLCTMEDQYHDFLIKFCPLSFFLDIIAVDISDNKKFYRNISLFDSNYKSAIVKRFADEFMLGNCAKMAVHSIWDSNEFIQCFLEECKKQDMCKRVLQSEDESYGENLLYWSMWNKTDLFMKWIIRMRKKLKLSSSKSFIKCLFVSCFNGNLPTFEYLHKRISFSINEIITKNIQGRLPILVPNPDNLSYSSNFTIVNDDKRHYDNVLFTTVACGGLDMLEYFLEKGVNINYTDSNGYTSLHVASRNGLIDIVEFLLRNGADVSNVTQKFKETVLHEACCRHDNVAIVRLLLEKDISLVRKLNDKQQSPLHKAVSSNNIDLFELVFQATDMYSKRQGVTSTLVSVDFDGNTLLHFGCMMADNTPMLNHLIKKEPNLVYMANIRGNTPLHTACRSLDCLLTVAFLLSKDCDINARNKELNTPLHLACLGNKYKLTEFLLKNDKIKIFKNGNGKLPYQLTENGQICSLFQSE